MKTITLIVTFAFILFVCISVSANWSEDWTFEYDQQDYDPQGFELYTTLTFGEKADVTEAADPQAFSSYSTLTFGSKANITGNSAPINSNPSPNNGATGTVLNPSLNITINDPEGNTMNQSFWTNASGTWDDIGFHNNTGNASVENTTTSFPAYNTKYWWASHINDGQGNWDNDTYYFTTKTNPINLTINATSGVEETNATLYGHMDTNDSLDTNIYFELDLGDQTFSSPEINHSVGVTPPGEFSDDVTGITPGKLYYCRVKAGNSGGWNTSWNTTYIFTKPNAASGMGIAQIGGGLNISWTHGTGYNLSKLYYNTTGYPTDRTSPGTVLIASTADDYYEHTGLTIGQTYYYRVWEYSSWSDPLVAEYSDGNTSSYDVYESTSPEMTNPNPADTATGISLDQDLWNITIKNYQGNFDWSIETSPDIGSNSSNNDINGSKECDLSGLQYSTTYTIYANATTTGTSNHTNNTYTFTTQVNESPVPSNLDPADSKLDVSTTQPNISVDINDSDGDTFNWSIETKPDVGTNSSDGASNGTFTCDISDLDYLTEYTWYLNITDGINEVNNTYTFTTAGRAFLLYDELSFSGKCDIQGTYPSINSVSPANNSVNQDMYPLLEVNVTEPQGSNFNITWSTNASGVWTVLQYNSSCTDGNYSYRALFANESDTKYWWKVAINDTDGKWTNATYNFEIATYSWTNWSEWWTFDYVAAGALNVKQPYPANESTEIDRPTLANISINVTGSSSVTIEFWNLTAAVPYWETLKTFVGENGRLEVKDIIGSSGINATFKEFDFGNTTIHWRVNATNETVWMNRTYWYNTTKLAGGNNSRYDNTPDNDVDVQDALWTWNNREGEATYNGIYNVAGGDTDVDVQDALTIWNNKNT